MHKFLIDVNVVLDVAIERTPYHESSKKILILIETRKASGYLSSASFPIIYYLIRKHQKSGPAQSYIKDLMRLFSIVEMDRQVLERALEIAADDFEDAIQMASAEKVRADYIITRNAVDYSKSSITALAPAEYLATFKR